MHIGTRMAGRTSQSSIDLGVSTLHAIESLIFDSTSKWIERTKLSVAVREANAQRLGNEEHVGDLVERVRVDISLIARVDMTWTQFCVH